MITLTAKIDIIDSGKGSFHWLLPQEYQEVEYIESTGTQWIDTELVGESGYTIEADLSFTAIGTGAYQYFSGFSYTGSENRVYSIRLNSTSNYVGYTYGSTNADTINLAQIEANKWYTFKSLMKDNDQKMWLDGKQIGSSAYKLTGVDISSPKNIYIFTSQYIDGTNGNCLVRAKRVVFLDENNEVVRNFVPCYRKSDGKIGMYDVCLSGFYENKGTGKFLKGADVVSNNFVGNNISRSNIEDLIGSKKEGANPFIIGASKLGDGSTFSEKVDYFIGDQLSDSNGNFANPYILEINGDNISSLTIAFDKRNGRHPNSINIDGTDYFDNDAIFTIPNLPSANYHRITISNWNAPNYPIVITGIYINVSIDINQRNLISLESSILSRGDIRLPSFGIISNTGRVEFNDFNGEVMDYAEQKLLQRDLQVTITLKDTLTKNSETVGKFETESWNYDNDNRSVSVSLKDNLEEWQDILCEGLNYDPRNPKSQRLKYFYDYLVRKTPKKYAMASFNELDSETQKILNNTIIAYEILNEGTLWQQWTKLCEVGGLYIYKLPNGLTTCRHFMGG